MLYSDNNGKKSADWHTINEEAIFRKLETGADGLTQAEAKNRLLEYGRNSIPEGKKKSIINIFLGQFKDPLIYVLLVSAIIVNFLGEFTDGIIIVVVLVINSLIGTIQELKARKTLDSLKEFTKGMAIVVRGGREFEIEDTELTPGDLIIIRDGYKIPSDARLIMVQNLRINESALTGESTPVEKILGLFDKKIPIPERKNMLYKGTFCVSGQGKAIVTETGASSYVGKISRQLIDIDAEMPLKEKMRFFSRVIGLVVFGATIFMFTIGLWRGLDLYDIFFTATAVSVAIIPSGLPIIITLILARGVYKMAKRNALVKNMQAVEALGQANVIAVDKTGTITKNELMVEKVFVDFKTFTVTGSGFNRGGNIILNDRPIEIPNHREILFAGKIATFCASASVEYLQGGEIKILGDPTEAALIVFGQKVGFTKSELESEEPIIFDVPFSFKYKFHATLHQTRDLKYKLSIIGAPESVLSKVSFVWENDEIKEMDAKYKEEIYKKIEEFSSCGLRVLAFAYHKSNQSSIDLEQIPPLTFGGLFAMADVLRSGVSEAVAMVKKNNIKTVMITGDFIGTAKAIAKEANIYKEGDTIITGPELDILSTKELSKRIHNVSVFARVLPEQKLKIVEAYKFRGDIVCMTGDGVNDALSLQAAHLGIAMGRGGTDVAKDASDIVLLDNNFKSIIAAIEEGRSIYSTIKKIVLFLISTSLGGFLTIAGSLILGLPLPLYPSQILWLNLITDGFMVISLGFEPKVLLRDGERGTNILTRTGGLRAIIMGLSMAFFALVVFYVFYLENNPKTWTITLTVLVAFQWFNAWNVRSETRSAFVKPFSNIYLLLGLFGAVFAHILAVYHPFMNTILRTVPLNFYDWVIAISIATSILLVEEIRKLVFSKSL